MLIAVILVLTAGFLMRDRLWTLIGGPADQGPADFAGLVRSDKPNSFLLCPQTLCTSVTPDAEAPVFAMSAAALREKLHAITDAEPGTTRIDEDEEGERYVVRTPLMHFPDTVSVRYLPLGPDSASLAIYSRSLIGYSDMGTNRARVERWISTLQASAAAP
jgi:uncharacterized protein (DUF1499 family)